jgi:hypothetical protein
MKKALTYMFNDKKFWLKALPIFLLVLPSTLFTGLEELHVIPQNIYWVLSFIALLCLIIPVGYSISCIKTLMTENDELPFINVKNDIRLGIKYSVSVLLFIFAISLFWICLLYVLSFVTAKIVASVIFTLIFLLTILCVAVFYFAMNYLFAKQEKFITFFRFKSAFKLIKSNMKNYLKAIGIYALVHILIILISYIIYVVFSKYAVICVVLSTMLTAVLHPYILFLTAYLIAKSITVDTLEQ